MPDLKDTYFPMDYKIGFNVADVVLNSILKNVIDENKRYDLYQKFSFGNVSNLSNDEANKAYGDEFNEPLYDILAGTDRDDTKEPKPTNQTNDILYKKFITNSANKPLKMMQDGAKELDEIMDKKYKDINFKSDSERNFYFAMKCMVHTLASGKSIRNEIIKDPAVSYAWNMFAKVAVSSTNPTYNEDTNRIEPEILEDVPDYDISKTMKSLGKVGIPEAWAGCMRVNDRFNKHIETGDVTRYELIEELKAQKERIEKATGFSKEKFDEIEKEGAFLNKYDEYTDGERGFKYVYDDLDDKIDFLESGWPVEDAYELSKVNRIIKSFEKDKIKLENEINADKAELEELNKPDNKVENKDNKIKELNDRIELKNVLFEQKKTNYNKINKAWEDLKEYKNISRADRMEYLTNLKDAYVSLKESGDVPAGTDYVIDSLDKRINAKLKVSDKALMADTLEDMYKRLDEVDPTFMKSSDQFRSFKNEFKKLLELKKNYNKMSQKNKDIYGKQIENASVKYQNQFRKTIRLGGEYLKYKNHQLNGVDGKKHTRSETEKNRVQTVDAIVMGMYQIKDNDIKIVSKNYHPRFVAAGSRIMEEVIKPSFDNKYEEFIYSHTGRGAINGTIKEMADDVSKVIAAEMLRNKIPKAEFNEKNINTYAKQIKNDYMLESLNFDALREYLMSPKNIRKTINKIEEKTFGLTDKTKYSDFVNDMRELYRCMDNPQGLGDIYKEVYDSVERLAHLPDKIDDYMNVDRLYKDISNNVHKITVGAKDFIKKNPSTSKNGTVWMLDAVAIAGDYCNGIENHINSISDTINKSRGVSKAKNGKYLMTDPKFFGIDSYGIADVYEQFEEFMDKKYSRDLDKNKMNSSKSRYSKEIKDAPDALRTIGAKKNFEKVDANKNKNKNKNKDQPAPANRMHI